MKQATTFLDRVRPAIDALPDGADKDTLLALAEAQDTYWFMALYCAAKTAAFAAAVTAGAGWGTAVLHAWTEGDQALWAGVLNFWFLGRVFDRVRP
jgi:hypothetical protein